MGKWITSIIDDQFVLSDTDKNRARDLPKANFLGAVRPALFATNGATSNGGGASAGQRIDSGALTSYKIIGSGGDIYNFTDGEEPWLYAYGMTKAYPVRNLTQVGAEIQYVDMPAIFGRFQGDTLYVLPAKLFRTLQYKQDVTYTISATVGFATGTGRLDLSVDELVSDIDPRSVKMMKVTEQDQQSTKASGNIDSKLILGNKVKNIWFSEYQATKDESNDIGQVTVKLNNGNTIPFDANWNAAQRYNHAVSKLDTFAFDRVIAQDTTTYATRLPRMHEYAITPETTARVNYRGSASGDTITFAGEVVTTVPAITADTTNRTLGVFAREHALAHSLWIDFDKNLDGSEIIETADLDSLLVRSTQKATGGTLKVVVGEVVEFTGAK